MILSLTTDKTFDDARTLFFFPSFKLISKRERKKKTFSSFYYLVSVTCNINCPLLPCPLQSPHHQRYPICVPIVEDV